LLPCGVGCRHGVPCVIRLRNPRLRKMRSRGRWVARREAPRGGGRRAAQPGGALTGGDADRAGALQERCFRGLGIGLGMNVDLQSLTLARVDPDVELSAPCFSQWSQGQNSRLANTSADRFIVRGDTASRRRCWRRGGRPDRAARRPGAGSPEAPLEADGRPARACCLPVSFLE
jgi:hypothetical protein